MARWCEHVVFSLRFDASVMEHVYCSYYDEIPRLNHPGFCGGVCCLRGDDAMLDLEETAQAQERLATAPITHCWEPSIHSTPAPTHSLLIAIVISSCEGKDFVGRGEILVGVTGYLCVSHEFKRPKASSPKWRILEQFYGKALFAADCRCKEPPAPTGHYVTNRLIREDQRVEWEEQKLDDPLLRGVTRCLLDGQIYTYTWRV